VCFILFLSGGVEGCEILALGSKSLAELILTAFFSVFTDWMQHLLCDLPRLVINCTILAQVAYQRSLVNKGQTPTLNMPELNGITHAALAFNIMLQVCNLFQFFGALVVLTLSRMGKLVSLRKDEHLHTYCQRNLNVR
jgi:hypothetical protein